MSILSFNCRGLNSKIGVLSDYFNSFKNFSSPDVLFLSETKGGGVILLELAQKINYNLVAYAPAKGASGGVAIFLKKGMRFSYVSTFENRGAIIDLYLNKFAFRFIGVYGAFNSDKHINTALSNWISTYLCNDCVIAGDLNHFIPPGGEWVDGYLVAGNGPPDTHEKGGSMDKFLIKGFTDTDFIVLHLDYFCSDHRPVVLGFPKSGGSNDRWRFPDWILSVPEVVADFQQFLRENEGSRDWPNLASVVKKRATSWTTILLSDNKHKDSMRLLREEFINKEKVHNLNPCAKSTAAFRKAFLGPKGKGIISNNSAYVFYKNLYSDESSVPLVKQSIDFNFVTIDGITKYFKKLKKNISPGPSGFTARFFNTFSDSMAVILYNNFINFKLGIPDWWKEGIITVLPKTGDIDLSSLDSWRPISLLNIEYKCFTSLLNQLVVDKFGSLISKAQIGFVRKKWIQQHHLTLQSILFNCQKVNGGCLFTDFIKAYDSLSHSWILKCFRDFGGDEWAGTIQLILGGTSRVWLGGELSDPFCIAKGVRQGDVISPVIFNLAINALFSTIMITLPGVRVRGQRFKFLAYADDIVFFVNNFDELMKLQILLQEFKIKSGLCLSMTKSKFMPFRFSNCQQNIFPTALEYKYLGIILNQIGNVMFKEIYVKFTKRLEACNASYGSSSLLHRIRMINAYALAGLTYIMRVVLIPDYLCQLLKARILSALGTKGTKIGYDRMTTPFRDGGYGLIDIHSMNIYMLRTWLPYLKETALDHFTTLIDGWSTHYFQKYRRSALLSDKRVFITEELPALDAAWFDYTLLDINDHIPFEDHLFRLRSAKKVMLHDRTYDFDLKHRKCWRTNTKLRITGGQTRWINELKFPLMKIFKVLRTVTVPQYIQFWFFDSLHIILPVIYREDACCVCGNTIRSSHFHRDCPGLNYTKNRINGLNVQCRNLCAAYINFRRHLLLKHQDVKICGKWTKILETAKSSLLYECNFRATFSEDLLNPFRKGDTKV